MAVCLPACLPPSLPPSRPPSLLSCRNVLCRRNCFAGQREALPCGVLLLGLIPRPQSVHRAGGALLSSRELGTRGVVCVCVCMCVCTSMRCNVLMRDPNRSANATVCALACALRYATLIPVRADICPCQSLRESLCGLYFPGCFLLCRVLPVRLTCASGLIAVREALPTRRSVHRLR